MGFGLGFKRLSRSQPPTKVKVEEDEQWYIPYRGPVEPPPEPTRRLRPRDSWGDLLEPTGDDNDDTVEDKQAHEKWRESESCGKVRGRERGFSLLSTRTTTSSGAIDPSRNSVLSPRRATSYRPPVPSYIRLDHGQTTGGVGESPAPPPRETVVARRMSLASIFTFGSSPSRSRKNSLRKARQPKVSPTEPKGRPSEVLPDDYYNSFYSTLVREEEEHIGRPSTSSVTSRDAPTPSNHPYACSFPKEDIQPSLSVPVSATQQRDGGPGLVPLRPTFKPAASASTPDLRPSTTSSVKARWLQAETWCDAILFPRPRLKVKEQSSARIVSLPGTPLPPSHTGSSSTIPSRVIAHSRSMGNLKRRAEPEPVVPSPAIFVTAPATARAPRPKSFAADDLALINPVFSLEKVLEEGQELESQRRKWQNQAASSLGNSKVRTLARARSKSLNQNGKKPRHIQTSIDYLAARACLGSQPLTPEITPPRPRASSHTSTIRGSHTHTNSTSKSSHSRGHSHSGSWSKGAHHPSTLEGALRRDDTRVIRFPDPALTPIPDRSSDHRVSPVPSSNIDIQMGIAVSTTPLPDESFDRASMSMADHPYASAGLYVRSPKMSPQPLAQDRLSNHSDQVMPNVPSSSPPPPPLALHPYARATSPPTVSHNHPQARVRESVPLPDKMWAQLSPGVMREIRPEELEYSPFLPGPETRRSASSVDEEPVGLGEALTYDSDFRSGRDSGLGTSENHIFACNGPFAHWQGQDADSPRVVQRKPVQYDALRPIHTHRYHDSIASSSAEATVTPTRPALSGTSPNRDLLLPVARAERHYKTPSPIATSSTPSPQPSPRSLGSPNDLDNFHDLFYQPTSIRQSAYDDSLEDSPIQPLSHEANVPMPWNLGHRHIRQGSGLTVLARQLSEEYEQLERERSSSTGSSFMPEGHIRRTTEGGLQFVFEGPRSDSPIMMDHDQALTTLIKPTFSVPEDVSSFSASSDMGKISRLGINEDEDMDVTTVLLRVGMVDAQTATPPAETAHWRNSFTGLMETYGDEGGVHQEPDHQQPPQQAPVNRISFLEPPSSETHRPRFSAFNSPGGMMRSSYMTTSSMSRISGLSDFPIPPGKDGQAHHLSLLTAYFDETVHHRDAPALIETPQGPLSPISPGSIYLTASPDAPDSRFARQQSDYLRPRADSID